MTDQIIDFGRDHLIGDNVPNILNLGETLHGAFGGILEQGQEALRDKISDQLHDPMNSGSWGGMPVVGVVGEQLGVGV